MSHLEVSVPIRLSRSGNSREHWRARHKRTVAHKQAVRLILNSKLGPRPPRPPLKIVITRLGLRMMDPDNNVSCCKDVQDAVAEWIGVDDGSSGLTWLYAQEKASRPCVRIEFFDMRLREIGVALPGECRFFVDANSVEEAVGLVLKARLNGDEFNKPIEVDVIDGAVSTKFIARAELSVRLEPIP